MVTQFTYQPLIGTDIRLISIDISQAEGSLGVRLQHFPIEGAPDYIALSYVWEDSRILVPITVNGIPFSITQNLYQALQQMRAELMSEEDHGNFILHFWADAICIDQSNEVEKAKEVLRMGSIYESASYALGWLGMNEDLDPTTIELVFQWGRKLHDIHVNQLPEDTDVEKWLSDFGPSMIRELQNSGGEFMKTLYIILQRDFFRRIWIVQEAVLARNMILAIEDKTTNGLHYLWHMAISLPLLRPKFMEFQGSAPYDRMRAARNERHSLMSDQDRTSLIAFASRLDVILSLSVEGTFLSTIPHDYVYALLGIADVPDTLPENLKPNYSKSYWQVCFEYTRFLIEHTGNLNLLGRFGLSAQSGPLFVNPDENIPSWVPDLRVRSHVCHDPDTRASVLFSADGKCMTVQGVSLGNPKYIVQPQNYNAPFLPHDLRAEKIDRKIFRNATQLTGLSYDVVYLSWLSSFTENTSYQHLPIDAVDRIFSKIKEDPFNSRFYQRDEEQEKIDEILFPVQQAIETSLLSYSQFLTSDGFVGSLKRESIPVRKGDIVCLLKSMIDPVLLRPSGSSFRFVATIQSRCPLRESKFDEEFFSNRQTRSFDII